MNLSFSRQKSRSLRLTRVIRCRMGLEPDDPALLERDRHDPDPCQFQNSRRKRERGRERGQVFVVKNIPHSKYNMIEF